MEKKFPWIEQMKKESYRFDDSNPHLRFSSVQKYLSFYSFDMQELHEYRCGRVTSSGEEVFIQGFLKKEPKGTVFFVHGYLDHTGGLSHTVNDLLENNYQVVTVDLPGHGFSQGEPGTISTFDDYVQAVKDCCDVFRNELSISGFIGLGHSTGGAILFHAASEKIVPLDKLILVAPLYFPYRWNITKGTLKFIGKFIHKSKRRFKKNSEDEKYRKFVRGDPLQVQQLKSDWVLAMEKWQENIVECPILNTPVYLLQGGKDTTVDWNENIEFYTHKCRDILVAYFPAGRHQLLNEQASIRHHVYNRISWFLEK
ncbi:alpha/beta fold hydrolase [Salipaludibacillus sp. CF4.18]|uniref:alpha/beta fold hydrolase n=1 Tax=Salipaludibacillus sp. CF4.18 TaxID=3373081 RepID=UPI003EE6F415